MRGLLLILLFTIVAAIFTVIALKEECKFSSFVKKWKQENDEREKNSRPT